MSADIIWALDQRERCIACPSSPVANAVVLQLAADGSLARDAVAAWAGEGVMAAGVTWSGNAEAMTEDDWLDLEDAVTGLVGLAQIVAIHSDAEAAGLAQELASRTNIQYVASASREVLLATLTEACPA